MPIYGEVSPPLVGLGAAVWDDEEVTPGGSPDESSSTAISLHRNPNLPSCISVEVRFAADPGVFQIDLQCADTDEDEYYVTKASFDDGLNDFFVGRIEAANIIARFARLRMVVLSNSVNVTARIC